MALPLNTVALAKLRLPASPAYIAVAEARNFSVYDYIRDHIGYRLEMLSAAWSSQEASVGSTLKVDCELVNRGFSTIHNARPVLIALVAHGRVAFASQVPDSDPRKWQPFVPNDPLREPLMHFITHTFVIPPTLSKGEYSLGLWLPDSRHNSSGGSQTIDYAIRLANNESEVSWSTEGVNIFGSIRVKTDDKSHVFTHSRN